jgi:hypothetical protein
LWGRLTIMSRISRVRPSFVLAVAWLLASAVLTMLLAPRLGARGLLWLGLQDLICLIGCGIELHRGRPNQSVQPR